ncbi:MAG: M24 family metallopeptidase [Candidatus Aenigmatarchaeota archaeon]
MKHLGRLRALAGRRPLDAILVTGKKNLCYFTGVCEPSGILVIPKSNGPFIITSIGGKQELGACGIEAYSIGPRADIKQKSAFRAIQKMLGKKRLKIGYDARMPHEYFEKMQKEMRARLFNITPLLIKLRAIKTSEEVKKITKSLRAAEKGMRAASESIRPGITENELAIIAEHAMRKSGAEWFSFRGMVASGPNPAKPHFIPSNRRIRQEDLIVIDIGAVYRGYCSDISRTFCIKPSKKQKKIYSIVLSAQKAATAKARPGAKAKAIDRAARNLIEKHGYGTNFIHPTGHGVGLDIHEAPSISSDSKETLKPGMVFTIEPGIYISGYGGVRLEDMILLTSKGKINLTKFPKRLEV